MNNKSMRISPGIIVTVCMLGSSGCSTVSQMLQLPNNNMCNSACGSQNVPCAHQHSGECTGCQAATATPIDDIQPISILTESSSAPDEELALLRDQIDSLETSGSAVQEQLITLDRRLEDQRIDREAVVTLMRDLSTAIADVRQEIGEQQSSVDNVASRIGEQRERNERLLSEVERQLNDVLSQYTTSER